MNKIASFQVDHTKFGNGMYLSRVDGDITTYDVRMCKPNAGHYLGTAQIHTIEHIMATYLRNSEYTDNIIYVGPMGCRTGFYVLTRNLSHETAIALVKKAFAFISDFIGEIPGYSPIECGNYMEHDLALAKQASLDMTEVLKNWTADKLTYPK